MVANRGDVAPKDMIRLGRFERLRENAEEAAFLIWQMGLAKPKK